MSQAVEFLFDYASPWSYLVNELLDREPLPGLRYRPIYLRGLEAFAQGLPYNAAKAAYLLRDLSRCAEHEGVELSFPSVFPINGLYALRGALLAQERGDFPAYHRALFRAAWREDRDISRKEVVLEVLAAAGLPREAFAAGLEGPAIKDRLRQDTADAQERGVFGVPSFFVGDELFWGHDRLGYARRAAAGG
jgi:2-hydroxychromene-2-carboxylate isomerase